MEKLRTQLDELIARHDNGLELRGRLGDLFSVYPFNEYEYIISTFLGLGKLSLDEYYELRDEYMSRNMFLYVFEISAPRVFGEAWAEGQLKGLVPDLIKPSKKLDPDYSGQYDFNLDKEIRVEVKASRVVDSKSKDSLPEKALSSDSDKSFVMNFQQSKPSCCDVFVWVAVWRDVIRYWVLSSNEVANNKRFSTGQHRGNTGEGQLHMKDDNIHEFSEFEVQSNCLLDSIRNAYQRQTSQQE